MICEICQTRNPAGFCISCEKMLCEECSNLCEECGKMVCPECQVTTRSGRLLCSNCLEELRAKRKKAKAGRAAEEGEAVEEEFPAPEAVPRVAVRPWVASLVLGGLGVVLSLFFLWFGGAVHWSVFFVVLLGLAWALVGILGPSEQKAQAVGGVVLNLVPVLLALWLGIEAPWIKRPEEAGQQQVEELTEEQKFQQRRDRRAEMLQRLRGQR